MFSKFCKHQIYPENPKFLRDVFVICGKCKYNDFKTAFDQFLKRPQNPMLCDGKYNIYFRNENGLLLETSLFFNVKFNML